MAEEATVVNAQPVGDVSTGVPAEDTAVTESTPVEQTAQEAPETSEKTEITQDGENEGEEARIPKSRLDEVITQKNELESQMSELQEKAKLLDQLQTNPQLAEAVLKNFAAKSEAANDPTVQRADQRLAEMGYVKAEQVQEYVDQLLNQREMKTDYLSQVQRLEKEYDGSNEMPKFEADKVAKYMDENGFLRDANGKIDVERTFKAMYLEDFADAQAKQSKSTAFSEKPGAPMQTAEVDDRKSSLEKAKKKGNFEDYLKRFYPHNS